MLLEHSKREFEPSPWRIIILTRGRVICRLKSITQYGPAAVEAYAHKRLAGLTNISKTVEGNGCAQYTDSTTNIQKMIAIDILAS